MALNRDQLRAIIDASDFERLIGEIENEWFDCKSQPYQIERDSAKRELAKDVSSFANARGGYIFIGVRTKTRPLRSGDEVEIIRSFAQSLVNTNQYHDIINNWVYPEIENVKVEWKSSKNDSSQGIVIITIPQQKESSKPFLIMRTLDGEKHVEIVFGYAERKWDISRPLSVIDLQKALQSGFSYENRLTERLDNLEALVQKITENLATVTEQINELVLQRMERTAADE